MKKLIIIFITLLSLQATYTKAQITLDTSVTPWNGFGYDFYAVQISPTETKWVSQDTTTNTFNIWNMDFTPFITNIAVPEPFYVVGNNYHMEVIYVSRALFDCDTSNIEYAYNVVGGTYRPFYVMRTDGTQLFMRDSALAPWCIGCLLGSNDLRPIRNTSAGTKLFLNVPGGNGQLTNIYSLCGSLPEDVFDFTNMNQSFVKIFPNPTSSSLTFQINRPDNMNDYELVIVDNNAKEIRREKINSLNDKYVINVSDFSSGHYIYSLCTKTKTYQSGKFTIAK